MSISWKGMILEGKFGDFWGGFSAKIDAMFDENTEKTQQ